jgi:hypothetical protein
MALIDHPSGDYRFLPGIAPYSCGAVSVPGFEIAHVTLHRPLACIVGFGMIREHLEREGRPKSALCGIELRSPRPFSFEDFAEFNRAYAAILEDWGVFVGGANPVARTNVAPQWSPPAEPVLYGFSYSRPCRADQPPTFVVAGAGELPEGVLSPEAIVRGDETSRGAMIEKAAFVLDLMENRLKGLGVGWEQVTAADIYTVHPLERLLLEVIHNRIGPAALHGIRWFLARPPIVGIEFEMDVRGVRSELGLDVVEVSR